MGRMPGAAVLVQYQNHSVCSINSKQPARAQVRAALDPSLRALAFRAFRVVLLAQHPAQGALSDACAAVAWASQGATDQPNPCPRQPRCLRARRQHPSTLWHSFATLRSRCDRRARGQATSHAHRTPCNHCLHFGERVMAGAGGSVGVLPDLRDRQQEPICDQLCDLYRAPSHGLLGGGWLGGHVPGCNACRAPAVASQLAPLLAIPPTTPTRRELQSPNGARRSKT